MIVLQLYCLFIKVSVLKSVFFFISGERPFKCEICDKSFAQSSSMRKHERAHKRKLEKLRLTYRCVTCDDGFVTKEELVTHNERFHVDSN